MSSGQHKGPILAECADLAEAEAAWAPLAAEGHSGDVAETSLSFRVYVVLRLFNLQTGRGRWARRLARFRPWMRGQELDPSTALWWVAQKHSS